MKKLLIITTCINVILAVGCSKSGSSSNSTSNYSNFTLKTNNYDSGYYSSHPTGGYSTSLAIWNSLTGINQFLVSGFVDSLNTTIKTGHFSITFNHKPTSSGTYKIGTYFLTNPLTDSTCYMLLECGTNQYSSDRIGDVVNVTVSNGLVTANFSNISLLGTSSNNNNTWSGIISGAE